jgi:membrane protein
VLLVYRIIRYTFKNWQEDNASLLAAALAYYIIFALGPLILLLIYFVSLFYSQDRIETEIMVALEDTVGQQSAELVQTIIENIQKEANLNVAGIIGSIGLFLIVFALINQVRRVSNIIWSLPEENRNWYRFIFGNLRTTASIFILALLWLAFFVVGNVINELNDIWNLGFAASLLNKMIQFMITAGFFIISMQILTRYHVEWSALIAGGVFTAVLLQLATQYLIVYIGNISESPVYGTAGSFALLLVWIYFSTQIYILGTVFAKTLHFMPEYVKGG